MTKSKAITKYILRFKSATVQQFACKNFEIVLEKCRI